MIVRPGATWSEYGVLWEGLLAGNCGGWFGGCLEAQESPSGASRSPWDWRSGSEPTYRLALTCRRLRASRWACPESTLTCTATCGLSAYLGLWTPASFSAKSA